LFRGGRHQKIPLSCKRRFQAASPEAPQGERLFSGIRAPEAIVGEQGLLF
jgi:hypothetical protein